VDEAGRRRFGGGVGVGVGVAVPAFAGWAWALPDDRGEAAAQEPHRTERVYSTVGARSS